MTKRAKDAQTAGAQQGVKKSKIFTILVVDDSLAVRNMYRFFLQEDPLHTYRVLECERGKDGLKIYAREQVDCVLLDDKLPDMTGIDFLKKLGADDPTAFHPVLFVAGQGDKNEAVQAMRAGAQDHLEKGIFDSEDFQLAIHSVLGKGELYRRYLANKLELDRRMKEVEELNKALERSNSDLSDFSHMASHDLKEPLRKVRVFSEMILEKSGDSLDEKSRDYLGRVLNAGERMTLLLDGLLEYSRVTRGDISDESVDLEVLVQEVLQDLEVKISEKSAVVKTENLGLVKGNSTQIRQVMQNLLSNALKYNESKPPEVLVRGNSSIEGRFLVEVEDNGIGFEKDEVDKIFGLFQRLNARSKFEGSGVGLATVKKIVERLEGSIRAEGRPGEGATFCLDLPAG